MIYKEDTTLNILKTEDPIIKLFVNNIKVYKPFRVG